MLVVRRLTSLSLLGQEPGHRTLDQSLGFLVPEADSLEDAVLVALGRLESNSSEWVAVPPTRAVEPAPERAQRTCVAVARLGALRGPQASEEPFGVGEPDVLDRGDRCELDELPQLACGFLDVLRHCLLRGQVLGVEDDELLEPAVARFGVSIDVTGALLLDRPQLLSQDLAGDLQIFRLRRLAPLPAARVVEDDVPEGASRPLVGIAFPVRRCVLHQVLEVSAAMNRMTSAAASRVRRPTRRGFGKPDRGSDISRQTVRTENPHQKADSA